MNIVSTVLLSCSKLYLFGFSSVGYDIIQETSSVHYMFSIF